MTRALSILPQGTRVAFQAGSLHIEATITRYDAGEDGYYAVDNLGCAWFRSLRELTIKGTLQFSKPFADMDNAELLEAKTLQIAMVDANPANEVEYSILRQISLFEAASNESKALIVVKDAGLNDAMKRLHPNVNNIKFTWGNDGPGYSAGVQAGKTISLNEQISAD